VAVLPSSLSAAFVATIKKPSGAVFDMAQRWPEAPAPEMVAREGGHKKKPRRAGRGW
jgi:hypothetical protein